MLYATFHEWYWLRPNSCLAELARYNYSKWSNFRCRQWGVSLCTYSGYTPKFRIATFGLKKLQTSLYDMVQSISYCSISNSLGVMWQTDRRTDRHFLRKCRVVRLQMLDDGVTGICVCRGVQKVQVKPSPLPPPPGRGLEYQANLLFVGLTSCCYTQCAPEMNQNIPFQDERTQNIFWGRGWTRQWALFPDPAPLALKCAKTHSDSTSLSAPTAAVPAQA